MLNNLNIEKHMKSHTLYDIINKLNGSIRPLGDSVVDEKILDNLKERLELLDTCIYEIDELSLLKNDHRHYMSLIGLEAHNFITNLKKSNGYPITHHNKV